MLRPNPVMGLGLYIYINLSLSDSFQLIPVDPHRVFVVLGHLSPGSRPYPVWGKES